MQTLFRKREGEVEFFEEFSHNHGMNLFLFIILASSIAAKADVLQLGTFKSWERNAGYVISAPHGKFDLKTEKMVEDFCETVLWNCVTATGFRSEKHPYNVNRPTEGINVHWSKEITTQDAALLYEKFQSLAFSQGVPKFYVEIHGNNREESANRIEIASVGLKNAGAKKIVEVLNAKRVEFGLQEYEIWLEPLDEVYFSAEGAKKMGILAKTPKALHFELPYSLRTKNYQNFVKYLIEVLPQVAERI